ncbi:hypothetical protein J6590_003419 [Homalodisca vitripennis]|nr:hypothetical protein J6590_003419 [Homalodisca vitripennis]
MPRFTLPYLDRMREVRKHLEDVASTNTRASSETANKDKYFGLEWRRRLSLISMDAHVHDRLKYSWRGRWDPQRLNYNYVSTLRGSPTVKNYYQSLITTLTAVTCYRIGTTITASILTGHNGRCVPEGIPESNWITGCRWLIGSGLPLADDSTLTYVTLSDCRGHECKQERPIIDGRIGGRIPLQINDGLYIEFCMRLTRPVTAHHCVRFTFYCLLALTLPTRASKVFLIALGCNKR